MALSTTRWQQSVCEQEYLYGELVSEIKHEYIDGDVFAMVAPVQITIESQPNCLGCWVIIWQIVPTRLSLPI